MRYFATSLSAGPASLVGGSSPRITRYFKSLSPAIFRQPADHQHRAARPPIYEHLLQVVNRYSLSALGTTVRSVISTP